MIPASVILNRLKRKGNIMKERFVATFDKTLNKNMDGEIENILITDDNSDFLACALNELREWCESRKFNLSYRIWNN